MAFRDSLTERGKHSYELLVESPDDTLAENNLLQGVVAVKGTAARAFAFGATGKSARDRQSIAGAGLRGGRIAPEAHPLTLSELSAYDLLVLDNVPAFQLSHAKMETIEKYVRDLGGGLLVIGGSQSYGAGGYFRTPLERILPVDMRPPARLEMPHVALLFVLDKSGSMGAGARRQHQARSRQSRRDRCRRYHEPDGSGRYSCFRRQLGIGLCRFDKSARASGFPNGSHRCNPTAAPIFTKRWSKRIAASPPSRRRSNM